MLRAAAALAGVIRREEGRSDAAGGPVVLLVGSGDNGGDALFAGAELAGDGIAVIAIPAAERMHPGGAAAARAAGVRVLHRDDTAAVDRALRSAAVVVDGLLGTGTSSAPALRGAARNIVAAAMPIVEERGIPVVAVDLPSGIHPDDGSVPDPTVLSADITVTFGAVKAGLLLEPGASRAGRVELVDLGLGPELAAMTPLVTTDRS